MNRLKNILLLSTCTAIGIHGLSASAQEQKNQDSLDEVLVTATKTGTTSLQSTPLAVSAFTADKLNDTLSSSIKDLAQFTPSLVVSELTNNAIISIRGVSSNNVFNGSDPDVTVQNDGVYLARPSGEMGDFLDVERVEILRGPQGTLYGRNAVGGTVNVISRQPTDSFTAQEQLTLGNYGLFQNQAYVSGPIVPGKLQASLSTNYSRHDDYEDNIVAGSPQGGTNDANHGGGRLQVRFEPTDWIDATTRADFTAGTENLESYDHLLVPYAPSPQTNTILGNYRKVALVYPQYGVTHTGGVSEDIAIQLDDHFSLRSLTAYRIDNFKDWTDVDATAGGILYGEQRESESQFSQEVDLNAKFSNFEAVGGLYYFHERDKSNVYSIAETQGLEKAVLPLTRSDSEAVFAQGTYHLTPAVSATAGIRYTEEAKSDDTQYQAFRVVGGASLPGFPIQFGLTRKFAAGTPKFGLDWQVDPDALVYVSATKGYKSGGINFAAASIQAASFAPEKMWSYEVGAKTQWLDKKLRLNLAAFHYDYDNLQVQSLIAPGVASIGNAATASANGVEAELTAKLTSAFQINANFSYLNATYSSFSNDSVPTALLPYMLGNPKLNAAAATYDAGGNDLDLAPRYSGTLGGQYTVNLPDGTVTARADFFYQSRVYFDPTNSLLLSQGSYGTLNSSLSYTPGDGAWQFTAWGKNLTDKLYLAAAAANGLAPAGLVAPPRTFGLRVTRSW